MCGHSWEPLVIDEPNDSINWAYHNILYLHVLLPGQFPLCQQSLFPISEFYKKKKSFFESSSWNKSVLLVLEIHSPSVYITCTHVSQADAVLGTDDTERGEARPLAISGWLPYGMWLVAQGYQVLWEEYGRVRGILMSHQEFCATW